MSMIDRETDIAIAVQLMGFKVTKVEGMLSIPLYTINSEYINWDWETGLLKGNLPNYSTNIEAAFIVVEKMREMGYTVEISSYPDKRLWLEPPYEGARAMDWVLKVNQLHYQCRVWKYHEDVRAWIIVCDPCAASIPQSICLAALETLL